MKFVMFFCEYFTNIGYNLLCKLNKEITSYDVYLKNTTSVFGWYTTCFLKASMAGNFQPSFSLVPTHLDHRYLSVKLLSMSTIYNNV